MMNGMMVTVIELLIDNLSVSLDEDSLRNYYEDDSVSTSIYEPINEPLQAN